MTNNALRLIEEPSLREPVLLASFAGWNDAAEAATGAIRYLIRQWSAVKCAEIDPEDFYDFTEVCPTVRMAPGQQRQIDWPANDVFYVADPKLPHDLVMLAGVEPQLRWRTFCGLLVEVIQRLNIRQVILLGGLVADVPHTRPVRVSGGANESELTGRLEGMGLHGSRYEGPTGIVGVFSDALRREGITCASLWATVPHYISTANPRATEALLTHVRTLLNLRIPLADLEQEAQDFDLQVARAVERDPEVAAYVRQLEESEGSEDEAGSERPELPTGDAVIRELEDFLRQSRGDSSDV
ncbi:MAG: PAC2 family protein [Dehalococcoidia bacterium]